MELASQSADRRMEDGAAQRWTGLVVGEVSVVAKDAGV